MVFHGFKRRVEKYGLVEAKKSVDIEIHTAREFLRIIEEHGLAEQVDLVSGGHTALLDTPEVYEELMADLEASRAAGVDLSNTRVIDAVEMQKVRSISYTLH